MNHMICALMGYMGSGKSTVGKRLASEIKTEFIDLDRYIENKENVTVIDLIKQSHLQFRKLESFYLENILKSKQSLVLSLGGGTPVYGQNLQLLSENQNVTSFYLRTSVRELSLRLFKNRITRPLIPSEIDSIEKLQDFIGKHLLERVHYYNQADFIIDTEFKTVKKMVSEINQKLISI